jgi:hypothetical protein
VDTKLMHGHNMGAVWPVELGDVRRPTGQWREAVRAAGVCGRGAWHRPRAWHVSPLPCYSACGVGLGSAVTCLPRRPCTVRTAVGRRDRARRRAHTGLGVFRCILISR